MNLAGAKRPAINCMIPQADKLNGNDILNVLLIFMWITI